MRRLVASAVGVAACFSATAASAQKAPTLTVLLSCRHETAPGRILCELDVEARGAKLRWADALVVRAPDFARPLRARIGAEQANLRTDSRVRLPLALLGTRTGTGELIVRGRAVVCSLQGDDRSCRAETQLASTRVVLGPTEQP